MTTGQLNRLTRMLTIHQLHTLLEFAGDHSLHNSAEQDDFEELEKLSLLERDPTAGHGFFRATPLGMRVMRAASGAANEEHSREMVRREKEARCATIPKTCLCRGSGWVWAHELPDHSYDGEVDDTQYDCPECREREESAK